ncbi:MAG: radical SAM protein [Christensenellales bacterium]
MRYEGILYRPPSEAYSLIVQATIGCSHNRCSFCSMYKGKSFRIRSADEVISDIEHMKRSMPARRIFIADGDALALKTDELYKILDYIVKDVPQCERVGIYGSPASILSKSDDELRQLCDMGLGIVYTGLESGCDDVLKDVNKGYSAAEIIEACLRVKRAGIKTSITAILGLAGKRGWQQHAAKTGRALSAIKPDYIGLLTLMLEPGTELYKRYQNGEFEYPSPEDITRETLVMLQNMDCEGSVFRSNHASNYLPLKATLNAGRAGLIKTLESALLSGACYRPERYRGL